MIMEVCSRWREITENTPQLWSLISLMPPLLITESLERSKTVPLVVDFTDTFRMGMLKLLPAVLLETYRFRELHIHWPRNSSSMFTSLFFPANLDPSAPRMKTLAIDVKGIIAAHRKAPKMMDRFWTQLISLRSMRLVNILPTTVNPLPSLTHLDITTDDEGNCLSTQWVLQLLRSAPILESIKMGSISSNHPITLAHTNPITLPRLRNLDLKLKYLGESALFRDLRIPAVTTVSIDFQNDDDDDEAEGGVPYVCQFISGHFSTDIPHSLHVKSYANADDSCYKMIVTQENPVQGATKPTTFTLSIAHLPYEVHQDLRFIRLLPMENVRTLTLTGRMEYDHGLAWSNVLPLLTRVENVSVEKLSILRLIAGPDPHSSTITNAEFNNLKLEKVEIAYDYHAKPRDWSFFAHLCKVRHEHGKAIPNVAIRESCILKRQLQEFEGYTEVEWDEEGYTDTEPE
ncbi:hypothetical protein ONZ45_g17289 [Pleurotus djamor]|nr:hypothetical protein ONZ45_g17289 [Pleurotus djamor]